MPTTDTKNNDVKQVDCFVCDYHHSLNKSASFSCQQLFVKLMLTRIKHQSKEENKIQSF